MLKFKLDDEFLKSKNKEIIIPEGERSFIYSYPFFVKFFESKEELTEKDIIIGASFVYSWMPTMLRFDKNKSPNNIDDCLQYCNIAKKNERMLTKNELETLKEFINNSIVGTSKLLHFINQNAYPIWDSRVARCFGVQEGNVNSVDIYLKYIQWCNDFINSKNDQYGIKEMMKKIEGVEKVTKLRALELVLFTLGKKSD